VTAVVWSGATVSSASRWTTVFSSYVIAVSAFHTVQ
jgi:hypothetical protein